VPRKHHDGVASILEGTGDRVDRHRESTRARHRGARRGGRGVPGCGATSCSATPMPPPYLDLAAAAELTAIKKRLPGCWDRWSDAGGHRRAVVGRRADRKAILKLTAPRLRGAHLSPLLPALAPPTHQRRDLSIACGQDSGVAASSRLAVVIVFSLTPTRRDLDGWGCCAAVGATRTRSSWPT